MLVQFGNFRAISAGPPQTAIIYNRALGTFDTLAIEGIPFQFVDTQLVDTPRVPTLFWMNWALVRARLYASGIKGDPNANVFVTTVIVEFESSEIFLVFKSSIHREAYKIQIADFIICHSYEKGANMVKETIANFLSSQTPTG